MSFTRSRFAVVGAAALALVAPLTARTAAVAATHTTVKAAAVITPNADTTAAQALAVIQKNSTAANQVNTLPHINTMTRAMNVNVYQVAPGVFSYTSSMAIDDDGSDPNPDPDHQNQTTFTDSAGKYLGAAHVPFYVLGDDCWDKVTPCPHFFYKEHNIAGRQFALIFYKGNVIGAIFGDTQTGNSQTTSTNDSRELGEASVESANLLGIPDSGTTGGVNSGVTVTIFSGPSWVVNGTNATLNGAAQAMVTKALDTLGGGTTSSNGFSVAVSPSSGSVAAGGGTATATVSTATTAGSAQSVALSASGAPSGVTASLSPASVTSGASSTLTVKTTSAVAAGTYPITVTGTAASGTQTATYTLTVMPGGGSTGTTYEAESSSNTLTGGAIVIACSTCSNGARVGYLGSGGTLTFNGVNEAAAGTYNVAVAYTQAESASLTADISVNGGAAKAVAFANTGSFTTVKTLTVPLALKAGSNTIEFSNASADAPDIDDITVPGGNTVSNDFSINTSPTSASVVQGGSTSATISTAVTTGSAQTLSLTAAGGPTGSTVSLSPTSVTAGGSSTLNIATGSAAPGTYAITVTGTGSGSPAVTHSTTFTLTVTPPVTNDFSINTSPTSGSVAPGATTAATVNTAVTSGSAQSVSLAASGAPTGVTVTFAPSSVTAGGSSTATIATTSAVAAGTYPITITGTGSSGSTPAVHTATYTLTVTTPSGGCTAAQLLGNPGFESGATVWTQTSSTNNLPITNSTSGEPPHAGTWEAWMNGDGVADTDTAAQNVSLPSGCSTATLSFWLHIDTTESTTTATPDTFKVQVLSGNTVLATLATFSNLNKATGYVQHSVSLAPYLGQNVTVKFTGTETDANGGTTDFVLDDTALNVS